MSFFNKKEEVLDIELTQLGKYLLSKGRFKPVFYTFSDDEILYSVEYVGGTPEKAQETSTRIQKDTQRFKTLYEHDGVETRILALNGHEISKQRGLGWQARKTGRIEELPAGELYGSDHLTEEKMGADDRNLVRNMIGNSTLGDQRVPSWDIESIMDGKITTCNVSSSSPNVGIKRPVLTMEIDYNMKASPIPVDHPDHGITIDQFKSIYSGIEDEIIFTDNMRLNIEDNALVISMIERGTKYERDNFEVEFFEVETKEIKTKQGNAEVEQLKRIYTTKNVQELSSRDYIEEYFELLVDREIAEEYGMDFIGINPEKLKNGLKSRIASARNYTGTEGGMSITPDEVVGECELE